MGPRGYEADKKVMGCKRHIVVDTSGGLLVMVVHPADMQDQDGARLSRQELAGRFSRLRLIWADIGYRGALLEWVRKQLYCRLEIVPRRTRQRGLAVLPRRWVVSSPLGGWVGSGV